MEHVFSCDHSLKDASYIAPYRSIFPLEMQEGPSYSITRQDLPEDTNISAQFRIDCSS